MKRFPIPILLILCAVPAAGESLSPPGVVEARVVDVVTSAPIPGATITLRLADEAATQKRIVISNAEGEVRLTGVAAGNYVLEVALSGFVSATLGPFPVHGDTTGMPRIRRMTVALNPLAWLCGPEVEPSSAP